MHPLTVNGSVELASIDRNGLTESRHIGAAVVVSPDGSILEHHGDVNATIFPRSTLKPIQAVAALRAGASLTGAELVLSTASHCGSHRHTDVVAGILAHDHLSPADLACPAQWPLGYSEKAERIAKGETAQSITMNCSGKHAAFLRACVVNGWDTHTYLNPAHPLQVAIRRTVEEFTGTTELWPAIDGCGAPLYGMTLVNLATGISKITGGYDADATRLFEAVRANPWGIDGEGRDNTRVIEATGGLAKLGAEGVVIVGMPSGVAVAVKCLDGSQRPTTAVALTLLARAGEITHQQAAELIDELVDPITGGQDIVGRLTVEL
ncbi:MAG: hypothetical protein RIS25_752 [Actinomycetota bacterium]